MRTLFSTIVFLFLITGIAYPQLGPVNPASSDKKGADTPAKSTFKKVRASLNMVDITYSKAKNKDFNRVELSRRSLDNRRWQVIHTLSGDLSKEDVVRYRDSKIQPGREYVYRLQTIDKNGTKSPYAFSSKIKTTKRIEVENINHVTAKRSKGQVVVSWDYKISEEIFFIVYRTFPDGTLRQIGRCDPNQFTDAKPPKGQASYAVKPMRKDGNRGKVSEMVLVK